jgi:signal transduction histidine kinase
MSDRQRKHLQVVTGGAVETTDPRVAAVLEVLGGARVPDVAQRWSVDAALLHRWVGAFVDAGTAQVTNRPDAEAANQRDRFLSAFAHEMRTPLAVAQGWAKMLSSDAVPAARTPDILERLCAALERLSERRLDVELLATSSLGRLVVRPERVRVADLAAGLDGLTGIGGEGGDVEIDVDPVQFPRVLRDLWLAGSSLPIPRSLSLEVATVDPWVEIRVVRDADPIDTGVLQALFDPFDLNDDGTGVTIGLYLARALTVAHGGTIGVDQDEHSAALWVRVPRRRSPINEA